MTELLERGSIASLRVASPTFGSEHFSLLARTLKEGIIVQGPSGAITWANRQSEQILGLTQDQLLGRTSLDPAWHCVREDGSFFPGEEHPAMRALSTGLPQHDVVMGVHKSDDTIGWILASANLLPGDLGVVTSFVDITERVLWEQELRALHARQAALLDGANVSIIGTELDGTIHTYNAAAEKMLGWTVAEMVGKRTPSVIHDPGEVVARAAELGIDPGFEVFVHLPRTGTAETREWTYVRKDGSTLPVSLTVTAIRDASGSVNGFMGIAEDISERRRVTAELEKLALVASRTHNLVIVTDAQVRAEWVNEAFTRLTGYTLEEVKGRKIGPMVQGPRTDQATVARMRAAIRAGTGFQVEVLNYGRGGHTYWLEIDCRPFFTKDGRLAGFVAVETDITVRKAMEDELRQSESRLRAFVDGLPDTVLRISYDGIFRDVHAPDPRTVTASRDAYIGRSLREALPGDVACAFIEHIDEVLATNAVRTYEYQLNEGAAARDYEARIVPGTRDDVIVIVRDVSERKLLERLKDEFVSTVSHELRTPLTAIHGTLGLLAAGVLGPVGEEAQELVAISLKNSERLARLIDDILDLERVMRHGLRIECAPTRLAPLVERAMREAEPFAAEFNVTYDLLAADATAHASIDVDRFLQVLFNLLSNAAKYGDPGDVVRIHLVGEDEGWRISVTNRGQAIPPEFRERIFSRFSMVDASNRRARRGTGLGLAISKALIELMQGRIDFRSEGTETEFYFWLPKARPAHDVP